MDAYSPQEFIAMLKKNYYNDYKLAQAGSLGYFLNQGSFRYATDRLINFFENNPELLNYRIQTATADKIMTIQELINTKEPVSSNSNLEGGKRKSKKYKKSNKKSRKSRMGRFPH